MNALRRVRTTRTRWNDAIIMKVVQLQRRARWERKRWRGDSVVAMRWRGRKVVLQLKVSMAVVVLINGGRLDVQLVGGGDGDSGMVVSL